jgi:hypothetical protein
VAALLDLMIQGLKGVAIYAEKARELGAKDRDVDHFMLDGLFTRVTNVNFDPEDIARRLYNCYRIKEKARALYEQAYRERKNEPAHPVDAEPARWTPAEDTAGLIAQGRKYGVHTWHRDPDVLSAIEILIYGLMGMGAFAWHAAEMGKEDDEIYAFIHRALAAAANPAATLDEFVALSLECGKMNLRTMELLYQGHAERFGDQTPMKVNLGTRGGKGIAVSGHDLPMLEEILKQTEGKGISVYTHGEMLPANGYPGLRKYGHFAGNFGGASSDRRLPTPTASSRGVKLHGPALPISRGTTSHPSSRRPSPFPTCRKTRAKRSWSVSVTKLSSRWRVLSSTRSRKGRSGTSFSSGDATVPSRGAITTPTSPSRYRRTASSSPSPAGRTGSTGSSSATSGGYPGCLTWGSAMTPTPPSG